MNNRELHAAITAALRAAMPDAPWTAVYSGITSDKEYTMSGKIADVDIEIAEHLFHSSEDDDFGSDGLPAFSTDMGAAWEVVEYMAQDKTIHPSGFPNSTVWLHWWHEANLWADSAELAAQRICIAALAILDGERPGV
jgi:hypothetical protein